MNWAVCQERHNRKGLFLDNVFITPVLFPGCVKRGEPLLPARLPCEPLHISGDGSAVVDVTELCSPALTPAPWSKDSGVPKGHMNSWIGEMIEC